MATVALVAAAFGLGIHAAALVLVGPPPWLRIDVLWARSHWPELRLAAVGFGLALMGLGAVWLVRAKRFALTVLVLGAAAVSAYAFRDRLGVLIDLVS